MELPIINLQKGKQGKIIRLEGGYTFQRKLRVMGIREGKKLKMATKQPVKGPVVVEVDKSFTSLGLGIADKIIVEIG